LLSRRRIFASKSSVCLCRALVSRRPSRPCVYQTPAASLTCAVAHLCCRSPVLSLAVLSCSRVEPSQQRVGGASWREHWRQRVTRTATVPGQGERAVLVRIRRRRQRQCRWRWHRGEYLYGVCVRVCACLCPAPRSVCVSAPLCVFLSSALLCVLCVCVHARACVCERLHVHVHARMMSRHVCSVYYPRLASLRRHPARCFVSSPCSSLATATDGRWTSVGQRRPPPL
jgi:hypothetical protein